VTEKKCSKVRALVVDDEGAARDYLVELLEASGLAEVSGALGSAGAARDFLLTSERSQFDVIFLDVRLSGAREDGLEIARELASSEDGPLLVLATAFHAHALEAYNLGVVDYLLKPFTEQRVEQCLRRVLLQRPKVLPASPMRIAARRERSVVFFRQDEVWAFEAAARLARVHTAHGAFDVDLSLAAIEVSFGRAFVRIHRNWLVNLDAIRELERDGNTRVWVGAGPRGASAGIDVPVARERAQAVREMLLSVAPGLRRSPP
jgi:two-component system, LytTR family, response regulator LytT